jgi:FixJ family two-component response regulator
MEVPRIAVIDDDESVRESVVGLVESVGYEAVVFESAEEFLNSPNIETGAVAFLYKPFQAKALLNAVRIAAAETRP